VEQAFAVASNVSHIFFGVYGVDRGFDFIGRHFGWHSLVSSHQLPDAVAPATVFSIGMTLYERWAAASRAKKRAL
jgi:hypothetical protein